MRWPNRENLPKFGRTHWERKGKNGLFSCFHPFSFLFHSIFLSLSLSLAFSLSEIFAGLTFVFVCSVTVTLVFPCSPSLFCVFCLTKGFRFLFVCIQFQWLLPSAFVLHLKFFSPSSAVPALLKPCAFLLLISAYRVWFML